MCQTWRWPARTTARLSAVAAGKPIGPRLRHQDDVLAVALDVGNSLIVTAGSNGTARLWELALPHTEETQDLLRWAELVRGAT
jgi:hypothetical protein